MEVNAVVFMNFYFNITLGEQFVCLLIKCLAKETSLGPAFLLHF